MKSDFWFRFTYSDGTKTGWYLLTRNLTDEELDDLAEQVSSGKDVGEVLMNFGALLTI